MKKNWLHNERLIILAFWVMLFFVFWLQVMPQTKSFFESIAFSALIILGMYPIANYLSENLLLQAMRKKQIKIFIWQFFAYSLLCGTVFILCIYLFNYLENEGVFPLSSYFDLTELNPYVATAVPLSAGIIIHLCVCGIRFLLEYIKSQKTLTEYQLRTLQHQVTPHFMFNVLNHIHILMQSNVELASDLLIKYSEILRYQLYHGDKQAVSIEQDIHFLKDFIAVEQIRWGDKVQVACQWNIAEPQREIPSLLFITFVENAFKYVSKSDFEKGSVRIDFEQTTDSIRFEVENTKSMLMQKKGPGGLGIRNIRERLEILYNNQHSLAIKETDTVYCVKLIIRL